MSFRRSVLSVLSAASLGATFAASAADPQPVAT